MMNGIIVIAVIAVIVVIVIVVIVVIVGCQNGGREGNVLDLQNLNIKCTMLLTIGALCIRVNI